MAYDRPTADRLTDMLTARQVPFATKTMFGGLCYMVDEKMCLGLVHDQLMVRLDPALEATALAQPGCKPMDFTGKPMKGYCFVAVEHLEPEASLRYWVDLALAFNPKAKATKKRTLSA